MCGRWIELQEEQFSTPRFALFLVGLFAAPALLLAAIGIYGVISHSVSQRMREFGMRMALGASLWNLMAMVIKQGVALTVIGTALGLACALLFAGVLENLLYGVSALGIHLLYSVRGQWQSSRPL